MAEQLARERGVKPSALMNQVTEDHLTELKDIIQDWQTVGPRLRGISAGDVRDIDRDGFDQAQKRGMLIDRWAENGSLATYHDMVKAMLAAKKRADAEKVIDLLKGIGVSSTNDNGATPPDHPREGRLDDKPELGELEDLKTRGGESIDILERIGIDYERFGIRMLDDKVGDKVVEIEDEQRASNRIKREIVRRWLKGKGKKPVTWRTLVEVLDSMELAEVTKEIREALQ